MNKKVAIWMFGLLGVGAWAQGPSENHTHSEIVPLTYLDSIKNSFVNHSTSKCIESRWIQELTNQELFEEMEADVSNVYRDEFVDYELSTEVLKERLSKLDEKSPFKIEYNESLERVIKSFLKNRKRSFERLMGLSDYYFPIFEEHLIKYDVPLEVKYLAIVESALNPNAKSRMGATGLWQFMYPTGKQYNLEVNSFIDERSDPIKSSEAAAKYLSDLFKIFGDWDLVLASYNAGPGNVSKAIRRSGGYSNYWNIRKNLPRETQGYLPAFYATMYMFEYAKEHGINGQEAPMVLHETDTITVKKPISFEQVSKLLDISEEEIVFLNPTYKLKKVPYFSDRAMFLRLPVDKIGLFASNEEAVYAYVDYEEAKIEKPNYELATAITTTTSSSNYHTIRRGESLGIIASKYGMTVTQLKQMNNMKSNTIHAGKKLKVRSTGIAATASSNAIYTVQKGDSMYSISKKYPGLTVSKLQKLNNMKESDLLRPGMKLKING